MMPITSGAPRAVEYEPPGLPLPAMPSAPGASGEPGGGQGVGPEGGPWSVLFGRGTGGRPALEVYRDGLLVDVVVAGRGPEAGAPHGGTRLLRDARTLRDARAVRRGGRWYGLAWGVVADGVAGAPEIVFHGRRPRRAPLPSATVLAGAAFWLAATVGPARPVLVRAPGCALPVRRTR